MCMELSILVFDDCKSLTSSATSSGQPDRTEQDRASDAALIELARLRKIAFVGDVLSPIEDAWDVLQ